MEVQIGPNSVDEPNLLYKIQRKIKVFNTEDPLPNRGYNLVTSSSKHGIVFVASPKGTLSAYYLKQLVDKDCEPQHFRVQLQEKPTHIAVSCDNELLAVTGGQFLCIYKVSDFQNQNASPSVAIKCDVNPGAFVSEMQWNPCIPDSIVIAFFDGTLLACQVSTSQVKKVQSKARCLCWSPKGKQFVTGNNDGTLTQYKPDLTPAKTVPAPNLFNNSPVEALAIYWISTFQFTVVYKKANDNSRPGLAIVNTPKAGQPLCLNYEDICYSMGANRPWYYYLRGLAAWNLILSSSSNSMEIATLGSANGASWTQWCQSDEARPELPFTNKKQENYPVGICVDTCAVHQLPWGENETLPFMPALLVVSQTGLLTIFNIINLNKQAAQVCTPPTQLTLPAAGMTSDIPDDVVAQPVPQPTVTPAATPVAPKPQPTVQPIQQMPPQPQAPPSSTPQFGAFSTAATVQKLPSFSQPQVSQAFGGSSSAQATEQKPTVEVKTAPSQPQVQPTQKPQPAPVPQPTPQMQEAYAAMKAEQEKLKAAKANQELKNMVVKEVNDFQMELYKFMLKTRETQAKLQHDVEAINTNFMQAMDTDQLRKDCSIEDLRGAIIQLKLELVRACAVVAEARTHAQAKDLHQWTHTDPLTIKRVASVKKLAYYVQNQLEQAHRALDHKYNELAAKDPKFYKPGQRMIRPALDDVYQPLVKQQEILCRQQAVLKTLKNTLKEVDATPMFKSTSLLRSTPFRNKDHLSKLTKNILNMSIEPLTKPKEPLLNTQKLEALRDMLSNHKTVKIKPVNVELRQQLANMRLNYEKSMKEKVDQANIQKGAVKQEPQTFVQQIIPQQKVAQSAPVLKMEPKQEIKESPISKPFTPVANNIKPNIPVPGLANVARTLFTDEKPDLVKPSEAYLTASQTQMLFGSKSAFANQPPSLSQPQVFAPTSVSSPINTRSVLKDLLQNKQANAAAKNDMVTANKNDNNTPPAIITDSRASVLKDMLQSKPVNPLAKTTKSETINLPVAKTDPNVTAAKSDSTAFAPAKNEITFGAAKSEANTFMGQKICSPSSFSFGASNATTPTTTASSIFTAKPISDINNMFSKFQPQAFAPDPKAAVKPTTSECSEVDTSKTQEVKKEEKPMTNLFGSKSFVPLTTNKQPEVKPQEAPKTENKAPIKVILKTAEKSKENIPEKVEENVPQESQKVADKKEKEAEIKPLGLQSSNNVTPVFGSSTPPVVSATSSPVTSEVQKPLEVKPDIKPEEPKITAKSEAPPASAAASLFAAANASSPTPVKPESIFSASTAPTTQKGSIFELPSTTPPDSTEKPPLFGTAVSSASSIFGAAVAQTKTTQSGSIFGTPTAAPVGVFSSTSGGSIFGTATTTTSSSLFGSSTTPSAFTSEAKPSAFSSTPATAASVFANTTTTPSQSVFASSPSSVFAAASTQPTIFASSGSGSIFGTATTQASVFGSSTSTTSVFGTVTSQPSVFGTPATTTQSIFGTAAAQPSVFGSPATTSQNVFGTSTATTQASVFGTPTSQPSLFGSPTQPSSGSIFGSPSNQTSVFGAPTPASPSSVFGAAQTTQPSSIFGTGSTDFFASASISTTSAPTQSSGGNIFGGSSTGSVFGGGSTNVFGGKSTFNQSNPTAASIFGGGSGGGASFGQKPAANFWSGGNTNTATTGFGSGFGQQQASTQASSIFGGTTGGSFTTPNAGQAFGSPQQSAFGATENKPSVFGSPQQQTAPAFGGSPGFGSKPVFGGSPGFGSPTSGGFGSFGGFNKSPSSGFGAPATFGGGATFGGTGFGNTSPGKVFGGSSPGFGSPTQSNATFENLATQNTLTFGNLAQQSGQQTQAAPSFNTSPAFTGWRG